MGFYVRMRTAACTKDLSCAGEASMRRCPCVSMVSPFCHDIVKGIYMPWFMTLIIICVFLPLVFRFYPHASCLVVTVKCFVQSM